MFPVQATAHFCTVSSALFEAAGPFVTVQAVTSLHLKGVGAEIALQVGAVTDCICCGNVWGSPWEPFHPIQGAHSGGAMTVRHLHVAHSNRAH